MRVVRSRQTELIITFESKGQMHDCEILTEAVKMSYQLHLAFNYYTLEEAQNKVVMLFHGEEDKITSIQQFYIFNNKKP